MLLDFNQVRQGRSTQVFGIKPGDPVLDAFFGRLIGELEVQAEIQEQRHRTYLVTLRVHGDVEVPCRRCLSPAVQPVSERTDLLFEVVASRRPPVTAGEEEVVHRIRSLNDRVDIGPQVREVLFLAAEPYVVCRQECRGLCPQCGADLNSTTCACELTSGDPRWDKLHDLTI